MQKQINELNDLLIKSNNKNTQRKIKLEKACNKLNIEQIKYYFNIIKFDLNNDNDNELIKLVENTINNNQEKYNNFNRLCKMMAEL